MVAGRSRSRARGHGGQITGNWNPGVLGSQLWGWWDVGLGASTVGGLISVLPDQSGNARDLSQSNASLRPAYNTAANGFAVARFANAEWLNASLSALAAPFSIYLVSKFSATSNPGGAGDFDYMFSMGYGTAGNGGLFGFARWRPDGSGNDSKLYTAAYDGGATVYYDGSGATNTWKVYSLENKTSAPKNNLSINGVSTSISDYTNTLSLGTKFTIGGYNSDATPNVINFYSGDIQSVIITNATLSAANHAKLITYLGRNVGLVL